jgi:hypothetical protein
VIRKPEEQTRRPWRRLAWPRWRRALGLAIQLAGGVGVALCLVFMVVLPVVARGASQAIPDSLSALADGASRLGEPVQEAGAALGEASTALDGVGEMLLTGGQAVESVEPLLGSIGELVGEDAAVAVEAAGNAMVAAEAGAGAIDSTLRTLSYLGPLTGVTYDPDQSLEEGLAEVSAGLEPLPEALRAVRTDLDEVAEGLAPLRSSTEEVAGYLDQLALRVEGLGEVVERQSAGLDDLALAAAEAAERAPAWIWSTAGVAELLLLIALLEQVAAVYVGGQLGAGRAEEGGA